MKLFTLSTLFIFNLLVGCISNPFNSNENAKEEEPEIKQDVVIWANILNRAKGDVMYIFYEKRFSTQEECIEYFTDNGTEVMAYFNNHVRIKEEGYIMLVTHCGKASDIIDKAKSQST